MPETAASASVPTVTVTFLSSAKAVPVSVTVYVNVGAVSTFSATDNGCSGSAGSSTGVTCGLPSVGAASSSVMVPVPTFDVPRVALVGDARVTMNVSSGSSMASSVVCTSTLAVVSPASMVTVCAVVTAV